MFIKGVTSTGFNYEITEAALNNYELFEVIAEIEEKPLLLPKLVRLLFGKEQKEKLMDYCRDEDGTVPIQRVKDEIIEIFNSQQKVKNS
jgi:hypothetical protein